MRTVKASSPLWDSGASWNSAVNGARSSSNTVTDAEKGAPTV